MSAHQIDHRLTSIALAYANAPKDYIGPEIAPRIPSPRAGQYCTLKKGVNYQSVETLTAYGATPKRIHTASDLVDFVQEDHSLQLPVDNQQILDVAADTNGKHNLLATALMAGMATMMQRYEREVRDAVFADASYDANLIIANDNANRFGSANSKPIKVVRDAIAKCVATPNVAVCGRAVFDALAQNEDILKARGGGGAAAGATGFAMHDQIAAVLGLDKIVVGNAFGPASTLEDAPTVRLWDSQKYLALVRVETPMSLVGQSAGSFVTATSYGGMVVRTHEDANAGPRGSVIVQPHEQRKVLNLSTISGALIKNAIA